LLRKWFEVIDFPLREQIKKEWMANMERLHVSIPFFLWFPTFTSKHGLPNAYSQPSINVQTTLSKVWHFSKGGSVSSIHPPVTDLQLHLEGVPILATPFRKGQGGDGIATCSDIHKIHRQLNFNNTAISTIARQLNHVAIRLDDIQTPIPNSSENYANSVSKSFLIVEGVSHQDQEDFTIAFSNTMLINQITQQLKALNLESPSASCLDKTCIQNNNIDSENETDDESVINLTQTFEDSSLAINKIRYELLEITIPNLHLQIFNLKKEVLLPQIILMVNPSIPGIQMVNQNMNY